ncbi:MAG: metalloregulator ArsR/SmtB family transcription factor [Gemmatimonadaceae bacterium]
MSAPASLDHLATLADATRSRLLLVLERHEMTVGELCAILQLPQSSISRHLKVLGDEGWVTSRANGTSRYYRIGTPPDAWAERLWAVVRENVGATPASEQDRLREDAVLSARQSRSREYFSTAAGEWDAVREELHGARLDVRLSLALLDPSTVVGDLGCGTGHLSALLAPHVARVFAVDASEEMLAAARQRVGTMPNVSLHHGELEQLPIGDAVLDVASLALVLQYVPEPMRAIAEAHRVVTPGGRVVITDMMPHDRDDLQQRMGHVWRGFSEEHVKTWLQECGFSKVRYTPLPPDQSARGPLLFNASAIR